MVEKASGAPGRNRTGTPCGTRFESRAYTNSATGAFGWRFLGLSLAGYNVLISLLMAAIAAWGLVKTARR
jgi:disulfide bond formation protein DsbB